MTARAQALADRHVGALASALVLGVWWRHPLALVVAVAVGARCRRADVAAWCAGGALAGCALGAHAWSQVEPDRLGPFHGWATLAEDPRPLGGALRVTLEVEGERFDAFVHGSPRRRLERRAAGDRVAVDLVREPLSTPHRRRANARHVVGEASVERVWADAPGTPLERASNRLRARIRTGAEGVMSDADAALFTGLVIGDDARQPVEMIDAFRAAGLSHLTAVSGQNVALVLSVAGVGLRRLRTWPRVVATCALIAWFAVVTRLEPSVLRASSMAALSAVAFATGRDRSATRLLFVTVAGLVVIDPLLVWSVGFWLSVGATFGVVAIGPALVDRLRGPSWWRSALGVTLGAQLGVLLPSVLVFGRLLALGLPANLLAVPVAGLVMLYGLPAVLVVPWLPPPVAVVAMAPATLGTEWIAAVADRAAELTPSGAASVAVWILQGTVLASLVHWRANPGQRDATPARTDRPDATGRRDPDSVAGE